MSGSAWNAMGLRVNGVELTSSANQTKYRITAAMLDREPNLDEFNALNTLDASHQELPGGSSTFQCNVRLIGTDPATDAATLRALESRATAGCPNRPVIFNQFANDLVPTASNKVLEFNSPVMWNGLTGGEAHAAILSENDWPAETYEEVTSLPTDPASFTVTDATGGDADLEWDVDAEKYTRQASLDRVSYFVVERRLSSDPDDTTYAVVTGGDSVANVEGATAGKVAFTDSPGAGTYNYRVKAVDQYGLESGYSEVTSTAIT